MITSSENQQQEIKKILQTEVECAHLLLKALDLEYEALAEHHTATLEEIVQEKQEKIQQLEIISQQREELFASFGITFDKSNVDTDKSEQNACAAFNGNGQLTSLWNELVNIAEQCRDKNRVNGRIVELVSRQSRHALDILRGIAPATSASSELYDNAGQTKSFPNKRSLVHV